MSDSRPRLDSATRENGKILWDYLRVPAESGPCPGTAGDRLIMVLGSPDVSVASHAAELLLREVAEYAVVSGGLPVSGQERLEADVIGELIRQEGIAAHRVIQEPLSRHTSDHFWKTAELLAEQFPQPIPDIPPKFVVLVPSPIAERRALATGRWRWPGSEFRVDGVPVSYENYLQSRNATTVIGRMVGEFERILAYPGRRYMLPLEQPPPKQVWRAYERLREDFDTRPVPDLAGQRALTEATA